MAKVHLARDNVLDRDVALKVMREEFADEEGFVERFRREAKNAASLTHPSIVQIYDQGRSEDGTYYIAMEYVPGGTLKERIAEEGPLDPGEAAGIASRVAEALRAAHERDIVHRDIKPHNVLLSASGETKVADFGIARAASSKTITETNLVLGTAAYMSPEQINGEHVGPASDLYSLGVVLYEMLTGEPPYRADDPIATAMQHLERPPPHPRDASPAVPEDLDALTARLLAKDPAARYASAADLAEDLRRVRDGLSPVAVGPADRETARMRQDDERARTAPTAVAPGEGSMPPASPAPRRRALLPLAALLLGAVLLGGMAWALSRGLSGQDGAERVEVPDVVGAPLDQAKNRLDGAGLTPGSQDKAPSGEFAEGEVIEQDPAAGTEAERNAAVDLTVSTGPAQEPAPATVTPSATPTATATASPTATATASPASNAGSDKPEEKQPKIVKEKPSSGGHGPPKKPPSAGKKK